MSALPSDMNRLDRYRARRRIVAVLARTSTVSIYEVPSGRTLRIDSLSVCNVGTTTATFRLHVVTPGESAATSNAVYYDTPIRGNATFLDDSPRHLTAGDRIFIRSDTASAIALQIYGEET